jgi:HEAT repeat protein
MSVKIEQALEVLLNLDVPLSAKMLYNLSDLEGADRDRLYQEWGTIPLERRRKLLHRVAEVSETNFDMDFSALTRLALTDLDAELREAAVEASWTDESPEMLNRLLPMASIDLSVSVRAAATSALGRFIELGEHGKFDRQLARQAENLAIRLYRSEKNDIEIRRRALEALSNCSRPEVLPMIEEAYRHNDSRMQASAVYAMGRTCDERWESTVMKELGSRDALMRYEATRAAGELTLENALPYLAQSLDEPDREIMEMTVWALGEIGGGEAQRLLRQKADEAEKDGDEELSEAIEEALASASVAGGEFSL